MKDKAKQFYNNPTPANAVALAIADARARKEGTLEFFDQLHKAADQLREIESSHFAMIDVSTNEWVYESTDMAKLRAMAKATRKPGQKFVYVAVIESEEE